MSAKSFGAAPVPTGQSLQTARVHGVPGISGCARIVDDELAGGYTHGSTMSRTSGGRSVLWVLAAVFVLSVAGFVTHGMRGVITAWAIGVVVVITALVITRSGVHRRRVARRVREEISHVYGGGSFAEADVRSPGGRRGLVGVVGELRVADELDRLPSRFDVLHDLEVWDSRPDEGAVVVANVDHIVHTKEMCAVIETKVWAGPELAIPENQGLDLGRITDTRLVDAVEEACRGARDTAGIATCAIIAVSGGAAAQIPDGGVVISGAEIPTALARADRLGAVVINAESMEMFCSDVPLPGWRRLVRGTPLRLSA